MMKRLTTVLESRVQGFGFRVQGFRFIRCRDSAGVAMLRICLSLCLTCSLFG